MPNCPSQSERLTEPARIHSKVDAEPASAGHEPWNDLTAVLDAIPYPAFVKDARGFFRECNRSYCDLLGLPRDKVVGRDLRAVAPLELAMLHRQTDMTLLRGGQEQVTDIVLPLADGSRREVSIHKNSIYNGDGSVAGIVGFIFDRSEVSGAEHRLRETQNELRTILDSLPCGFAIIRLADHRIVQVNALALEMIGRPLEQVFGQVCHTLVPPHILAPYLQLMGETEPITSEMILQSASGPLPVLNTVTPIRFNGEAHVVACFVDLSAVRQTQEELRRSENRFRTIFENIQDVYYETTPEGEIQEISPSVEALLGFPRKALIGSSVLHLYADPAKRQEMVQAFLAHEAVENFEVRLRHRRGHEIPCAISGRLVRDAAGKPTRLLGSIRDITALSESMARHERVATKLLATLEKLRITQNQMLQTEKMASIGQLAAGVAHEINNPTGFVSSNLKTLKDYHQSLNSLLSAYRNLLRRLSANENATGLDPEIGCEIEKVQGLEGSLEIDYILNDMDELVSDCQEGTERIKKIVQDLKDFAHPGSGRRQDVDLNQVIESTINVVWNELKYKVTLEKDYGNLPPLNCFPQRLGQVFMNILVNAAQAIPQQGEIRIATREDGANVSVTISDTGCGIPPENLKRIFDPFFTTKEFGKGTGLGLHVVHTIIQQHDGRLQVESAVGKGTTFRIRLPAAAPPEPKPPPAAADSTCILMDSHEGMRPC